MNTKKSFKLQLWVLSLAFFPGFLCTLRLNAQQDIKYYAYHQPNGKQDTTRITNSPKTRSNDKSVLKKEVEIPVSQKNQSLRKIDYMSFVSLGLLPGSQDVIARTPVSLDISQGFFDPSGLFIGAGLAVETFDPCLMPLFFDIRVFFTKRNIKPWIGAKLGYAIPVSSRQNYHEEGGTYAGIGGGMIFTISSRSAFYFYCGYRYQKLSSTLHYYYEEETKVITEFNRLEFRLGLSFR